MYFMGIKGIIIEYNLVNIEYKYRKSTKKISIFTTEKREKHNNFDSGR